MQELRILLVEDSAVDAWMVSKGFKEVSYVKLVTVKDGQEAMDYIAGKGDYSNRKVFPVPHMILLDLKMPRVSGLEFLEWLRKQGPDEMRIIPVVVLSGSNLRRDVTQAYTLGANRFVVKTPDINLFSLRMKAMAEVWAESELPNRERGLR